MVVAEPFPFKLRLHQQLLDTLDGLLALHEEEVVRGIQQGFLLLLFDTGAGTVADPLVHLVHHAVGVLQVDPCLECGLAVSLAAAPIFWFQVVRALTI